MTNANPETFDLFAFSSGATEPEEIVTIYMDGKTAQQILDTEKRIAQASSDEVEALEDETHVYLLVETKAEGSGKRLSDEQIVAIQERFFGTLKEHGIEYQEATTAEEVYAKLRKVAKLHDN